MSIVTDTGRKPTCAAQAMTFQQRIELAIESLGGRRCICRLAEEHLAKCKAEAELDELQSSGSLDYVLVEMDVTEAI